MKVKCLKNLYMNTKEKAYIKNKIYETEDTVLNEFTNIVDEIDNKMHYLNTWFIYFEKID